MPMKVKHVGRAQKSPGHCEVCGVELEKGEPYKYAKGFRGPKRVRCTTCPGWKQSELETGPLGTAYAAREEAEQSLTELDYASYEGVEDRVGALELDVRSILENAAEQARGAAEECQESLDNMPEGLQQGPTGEQLTERIQLLEEWADGLENWDNTAEEDEAEDDASLRWENYCEDVVESASEVVSGLEL